MARHALACLLIVAAVAAKEQSRWSRQISSYTSDLSDWVPLPRPVERERPPQSQIKRQAVAEPRILAEPVFPGFSRPTGFSQDFPSRTYFNSPMNRQLYLQSVPAVPSAPQNYLTDQGFRFGLSQPNFALNQGFIGPQFPFDTVPPIKQRPPVASNPIAFPKTNLASPQVKPLLNQMQKKPESPKFIDGYRVENISFSSPKKPQSLQKLKYETFDKLPKTEMVPPKPKSEREEVQLLYVPLESLNRGQFNFRSPISHIMNTETFNQAAQRQNLPKQTLSADFQRPRPSQSVESFDQDYFSNFNSKFGAHLDQAKFSTISSPFPTPTTTPKPKKLKPHQPPLAIFITQEAKKGDQVKVGDVLLSLKNAESIAVLDSVNPQTAPRVFIGPSNLNPPETFVKFELPYLSNIEHTDKKLRSLPFFVAPLSYKTPHGFAKIPFPSPHVGSVIINSQIKESTSTIATPATDVIPNSYSSPQPKPASQAAAPVVTQKPSYTFYSTAPPKTNAPVNHDANFYTFEPQTVSTLRTPKEPQSSINTPPQRNSYFLNNNNEPHYPASHINFEPQDSIRGPPEPVRAFNIEKQTTPTTLRTTVSSTTSKPSTYPSQLLETHNPFSINQAFHFSTPLDYHNLFEENYPAQAVAPHDLRPPLPPQTEKTTPSTTAKPIEPVTEQFNYQTPNYVQNYSPEIHYESEVQNTRYPPNNVNEYTTKPEVISEYRQPANPNHYTQQSISKTNPIEYTNVDTQSSINENVDYVINKEIDSSSKSPYLYNQYETNDNEQKQTSPSTSTTTTTTTRRTPIRSRGRPRYTTTPRTDSGESSSKSVVTRRPLRERRPLPSRPKYEPNKITSERSTRKPADSNENTTKYSRSRTRGRIHYKPSESDDNYGKSNKQTSKENDLAYQRDILHQNYPVTLMERASTVDIEAITEPVLRISSTRNLDAATEIYDTENADSNDNRAISQQLPNTASKEETIQSYTTRAETQTEASYGPKISSTRDDTFQSRSSFAPFETITFYDDAAEKDDDLYVKSTTPTKTESPEVNSYATETISADTGEIVNHKSYSINTDFSKQEEKLEEETTPAVEITKIAQETQSVSQNDEAEENVVQTTPSYNRVRVRPGLIRQYHQSSTESSRTKSEKRKQFQAVTYRPAFNNRRTTMRIEEIEADLKTKQVHARPEVQDYRHPVYKPEPTTEATVTSGSTRETTTKRGVFRRRRPTYTTTTSTEASSSTKKTGYEVKSRFRGRRPTEKPSEKSDVQTEVSQPTSTVRSTLYNRFSSRPRLSERYNKKSESDESDDQDSNYSIHRPKYAEPESNYWSPKISSDSFKPYNPNDIVDEEKVVTTERRSDLEEDIITARNDYDDILISVTPASNTRGTKKIPDIPPTLEALVEQSRIAKNDSSDGMSTFETMLEEVMKSLEEQDEDEYSSNVMKHKGGEIGEIPPESIISSGDNYKSTTVEQHETTTAQSVQEETTVPEGEAEHKGRRRGFWKKVNVRPVIESIETAESQYYPKSANHLSHKIRLLKSVHDKNGKYDKPKVTTYKPAYQMLTDMFDIENDAELEVLPTVDIPKVTNKADELLSEDVNRVLQESTEANVKETTERKENPGEMDLGTGTPDPTLDTMHVTSPQPTTTSESNYDILERADGFSLMDYLFGATSEDDEHVQTQKDNEKAKKEIIKQDKEKVKLKITTEQPKPNIATTEGTYIPEELTAVPSEDDKTESVTEIDIKKLDAEILKLEQVLDGTEKSVNVETSSVSSFMNPNNVVSTSMSTEISHETEICFRGKCIKTSKDIL